jgi:8-oxo-dGTP diphosphatase
MNAEPDLLELRTRLVDWRPDLTGTLMFIVEEGRVLLIRKLRGHGAGKINGPGGKLDWHETPRACAERETEEEVGVRPLDSRLGAVLRFLDQDGSDWLGYVFVARARAGEPRNTAEAEPAWYPLDAIPFGEMWEDDRIWLPGVLAGERLAGDFLFRGGRLLAWQIRPLEGAPMEDGAAGCTESNGGG